MFVLYMPVTYNRQNKTYLLQKKRLGDITIILRGNELNINGKLGEIDFFSIGCEKIHEFSFGARKFVNFLFDVRKFMNFLYGGGLF